MTINKRKRLMIFFVVVFFFIAFGIYDLRMLITSLAYFITVLYSVWGVYHIILTFKGLSPPLDPDISNLKQYPRISVIIPAKAEPILGRTIETVLKHVDYPLKMKEIIVVTDDPHGERIAFVYQQRFPENVKLLARREMFPTKPSALNDALQLCTGDVISIVDVEDIPDRDVFLKAAAALLNHNYDVAQVILRINNEDDSWISRIFAMEYAGWFRIWLNGRAKLGLYTPLGGTGNYFTKKAIKYVGGWESTNLAEDAEVAVRITLAGMRICVINARHWEEAPTTLKAWIRQRTRWYRGWLQSLWKYLPLITKRWAIKKYGFMRLLAILLMLISPIIVFINVIAYALTITWILEYFKLIPPIVSGLFPAWAALPVAMNILYYSTWFLGAKIEGVRYKLLRVLPQIIFYVNIMHSVAAFRALYQEITKPIFWEKTVHEGRGVRGFVIK